jgi:hypothetical protein
MVIVCYRYRSIQVNVLEFDLATTSQKNADFRLIYV